LGITAILRAPQIIGLAAKASEVNYGYNSLMIQVLECAEVQLQRVYDQYKKYLPTQLANELAELLEELAQVDYVTFYGHENSKLDEFYEKLLMFENRMAEIAHFTQPEN
jgi:hypothetical protein